jgi:type II secretory pathway pseudopilin PulG
LVEVLIAIVILAVGIFAMAQFQAASLRNTAAAEAINRTTRLVRGELEWQRQTALEPASVACSSLIPDDFAGCTVVVEPCSLAFAVDGSATYECGAGFSPSSYRVTVSATGPRGQDLTLDTL